MPRRNTRNRNEYNRRGKIKKGVAGMSGTRPKGTNGMHTQDTPNTQEKKKNGT